MNGPILKEQAMKFTTDLSVDKFTASIEWLVSFLKGHNRVVNMVLWILPLSMTGTKKLPFVCQDMSLGTSLTWDKTDLIFRHNSPKTFHVKGEDCAGRKKFIDSLSVSVCTSMIGEKVKPFVIWHSAKQRFFKNIPTRSLPVDYALNKKSWMISDLYENFLKKFDPKMRLEDRKILLLLDNASTHPKVKLNNIKLAFLTPNTASLSQPMDQGITQTMKLQYRQCQLQYVPDQMD